MPIDIALVKIQGLAEYPPITRQRFSLEKTAKRLNKLQGVFKFTVLDADDDGLALGDYEEVDGRPQRYYDVQRYFDALASQIALRARYEHAIAITVEELGETLSFNRHSGKYGVITLRNFDQFVPVGTRAEQYLMYLLLCEAFCIVHTSELEHQARNFCLFDMCNDRNDLKDCIAKGRLDSSCRSVLAAEDNFGEVQMKRIDSALRSIGKARTAVVAGTTLQRPFVGLAVATYAGVAGSQIAGAVPSVVNVALVAMPVLSGAVILGVVRRRNRML